MSKVEDLSEDLYLFNCWQFGDWESLAYTHLKNRSEHSLALKACAQLQLGEIQLAKKNLSELPIPANEETKRLIISGLFNTLGKAHSLLDNTLKAELYYVKSLQLACGKLCTSQVYKARIDTQLPHLGLTSPCVLEASNERVLTSCTLLNSENEHFTKDLTLSFWLKIHSWPTKWTNIVSKTKDDQENEFCLRLKDKETAQWYYGAGNKAIILNNWSPKKYIKINEWAHIALVKKQGLTSRLYINGLIRSIRDTHGLPSANKIEQPIELLGQKQTQSYLDATIRDLRLHNKAQDTKQIIKTMGGDHDTTRRVQYDHFSGCTKGCSALDEVEFNEIKQRKKLIAHGLSGLDYYALINNLQKKQNALKIAIIGANDGKNNDPLYEYISQNSQNTQVVLVEPQQFLIPYLEQNYAFHPNAHVINCAVGDVDQLTLYAVKPEYWTNLNVPYAQDRGWPIYRAPTGVTSSNPKHVIDWLVKHLDITDPNDAIVKFSVPCKTLYTLMQECKMQFLDVLQIDTEGFDDYVLYNSDILYTKPKIIHFENAHLGTTKKTDLYRYLKQHNYQVFEVEEDTLALSISENWKF